MTKRLDPNTFDFPVDKIRSGFYSDIYFLRTQEILNQANLHDRVTLQIFQRDYAILCGIDEAIALIKRCAYHPENIKIKALHDGDAIAPWETVMTIEGDLADFAHLETVYLGTIARQTKVATNSRRAVDAAGGKLTLVVTPLRRGVRVKVTSSMAARLEQSDACVADVTDVYATPVYHMPVGK